MLVSEDFIMISLPKTGSSFVRSVIKKVHSNMKKDMRYVFSTNRKDLKLKEIYLENVRTDYKVSDKNQHGTYSQIPKNLLSGHREVVSAVRSPIEAYLSRYFFQSYKWVAKHNPDFDKLMKGKLPLFPEVSFEDYMFTITSTLTKVGLNRYNVSENLNLGLLSFQFIQFFSFDPQKFLTDLEISSVKTIELDTHFPNIYFLFNETLSQDIYNYLKQKGYSERHIGFIQNEDKINVTERTKAKEDILNSNILNYMLEKEELLFRFFPQYRLELELLLQKFNSRN